jgi:hypothetical protein
MEMGCLFQVELFLTSSAHYQCLLRSEEDSARSIGAVFLADSQVLKAEKGI